MSFETDLRIAISAERTLERASADLGVIRRPSRVTDEEGKQRIVWTWQLPPPANFANGQDVGKVGKVGRVAANDRGSDANPTETQEDLNSANSAKSANELKSAKSANSAKDATLGPLYQPWAAPPS